MGQRKWLISKLGGQCRPAEALGSQTSSLDLQPQPTLHLRGLQSRSEKGSRRKLKRARTEAERGKAVEETWVVVNSDGGRQKITWRKVFCLGRDTL
jgi:hypothetical protein